MADASIVVNTELDDKKAMADLNKLEKKIDGLSSRLQKYQTERIPLVDQAKELGVQLDVAKEKLYQMENAAKGAYSSDAIARQRETVKSLQHQWDGVNREIDRYDRQIKTTTAELNASEAEAGDLAQQLAGVGQVNRTTEALKSAANSIREKFKAIASTSGKALKAVGSGILKAAKNMNAFSKLSDGLKDKFKRLGSTLKSALVFSVIYQGLAKVRDTLGQYLGVNDQLRGALSQLKGAFLAAFQPIYETVLPALVSLVNMLTRAASAIASLVAAMFGTTTGQAQKNAEALYEQAKATEAAGGAAKEAEKSLASFDEINKLSGSSGGGGGGGSTTEITPDFSMKLPEKTPFESWGEGFSRMLDNLIKAIPNLEGTLEKISTKINTFSTKVLEMFTFPGVEGKVKTLGTKVANALNGFISDIDWTTAGEALGKGLNTAFLLAGSFMGELDGSALGAGIADFINGAITQIDWYNVGSTLASGFTFAISTLASLLTNINAIDLATSASNLVRGIFDTMTRTIQNIKWSELGRQIVRFIVNIDYAGLFKSASTALGSLGGAILSFVVGAVTTAFEGIYNYYAKYVEDAGGDIGKGILNGIKDALVNIGKWIMDNIFRPFIDGFNEAFQIDAESKVMHQKGKEIIGGLVSGIKEKTVDVLDSVKGIWTEVQDWFKEKVAPKFTVEFWKEQFSAISEAFTARIKEAINAGITLFNKFIGWINDKMSFSWDGLTIAGQQIFPSGSVQLFTIPQIPYLAQGAVIPPNREFMAVLGDQKEGTNIEAPLATIEQALENVLSRTGGGNNEAVMEIDGEVFAKLVYRYGRKESSRIGVTLVEGTA